MPQEQAVRHVTYVAFPPSGPSRTASIQALDMGLWIMACAADVVAIGEYSRSSHELHAGMMWFLWVRCMDSLCLFMPCGFWHFKS